MMDWRVWAERPCVETPARPTHGALVIRSIEKRSKKEKARCNRKMRREAEQRSNAESFSWRQRLRIEAAGHAIQRIIREGFNTNFALIGQFFGHVLFPG